MPKILEKVKNFFSGKFIYKPKKGASGQKKECKEEKKSEEQK